jgi:hypothetical protein
MNEIAKQNIREKLETAQHKEGMSLKHVGDILGISTAQVSWIKNPRLWFNIGPAPWEKVLIWINSGQSLLEYEKKHGKVVAIKEDSEQVSDKTVPVPELIPSTPEVVVPDEPIITIRPGILEKRQKELEHKRMSNGQLIDLLLQEKEILQQKIEAIDVLLKHYIS